MPATAGHFLGLLRLIGAFIASMVFDMLIQPTQDLLQHELRSDHFFIRKIAHVIAPIKSQLEVDEQV